MSVINPLFFYYDYARIVHKLLMLEEVASLKVLSWIRIFLDANSACAKSISDKRRVTSGNKIANYIKLSVWINNDSGHKLWDSNCLIPSDIRRKGGGGLFATTFLQLARHAHWQVLLRKPWQTPATQWILWSLRHSIIYT